MKNILIPTDFSENSWNAIEYGVSFFKKVSCNFYLLHVSPSQNVTHGLSQGSIDALFNREVATDDPKQQLNDLLKKVKNLPVIGSNHRFFTIHEHLFFIDAMRKQVAEKSIDFIVMGTKGASGIRQRAVGTNTGDVITKVKCPVLVIPEKARYKKPETIAFPTDYNIYYKSKILDTITEILSVNSASLKVLHITKQDQQLTSLQEKNKDFLDDYLGENIDHSFHSSCNKNMEEAVQCFVEHKEIDIITMIAKNLNFFQRILFNPLVEKISYHTEIPFLVLHE
ncbi:universal stress protein [Aquimarina algicola]|uniref:Universal stress protein n=1 Tax=Aquimarina algicola TaxID=2589995 RepID=A0A504JI21_9FLAO|nr:universal stress protein [Aquimarina algicola]TPN87488.1 universal stress protein [Aquimarina algicola]